MSNQSHSPRVDAYELVTARIIEALERGIVPWARPWRTADAGFAPTSLTTGNAYRGVNAIVLGATELIQGYESHYWVTYREAKRRGGHVRRGETSTPVVFWKFLERRDDSGDIVSRFPLLRAYHVFNVAQCEGFDYPKPTEPESNDRCEQISAGMRARPEVRHSAEDRAYYTPISDYVHLPLRALFNSAEDYYGTLFHELVHSTGHSSRLNRPGIELAHNFGDEIYAYEELIAEIGSAFVCGAAGIAPRVDASASYISGWLDALQNDRRMIVSAASAAAKATDWILGQEESKPSNEEEG